MSKKPKVIKKKLTVAPLKVKITHKLKKKIMPKITVPKIKGKPKGKNKKVVFDSPTKHVTAGPISKNAPKTLPEFLNVVEGQSYFASNKGRLTNEEIIDNKLEFACTTGNVWNYKFK